MAILDATDELHPFAALALVDGLGQRLVQIVDQHAGILRLQVTAVMGDDLAIFKGDDVTAYGEVVGLHVVADAGSLQRSAALVHLVQVVAQDGGVGHLTARRESFRHGDESARAAVLCEKVHHGLVGSLQQRFATQSLHGVVGHSITQYDDMFHKCVLKSPSLEEGLA